MAQKSLYDVLLVDQNATLEEIKLAFKRRALQVHPDKGGSKEEFHLVYQALETLGDPAARQKYDHRLATTKTGPAPHASHAPYPTEKKTKREGKHAEPATSCKTETKTKPQTFGKKSATSAGKAPSKPPQATGTAAATSAELQSPQTKLLMKIRDLLKQLPRDARSDVITSQFSQKQRILLEKWMVDNADTSSGAKCHSEAEGLASAATVTGKRRARSSGWVRRYNNPRFFSYSAGIRFDSIEMRTGSSDLKTSLDYLLVLTAVKQKMQNHTGGTFVERLQASLGSCAAEHGCSLADFKLSFGVFTYASCFIGSCTLMSPSVRSLDILGKMRSVLEPFRQYSNQIGVRRSLDWQFNPVQLEDAWERFQSAVAQAWELAGVDSTAILQKICSLYEAQAPFRSANLQRWEQQHMARQDKNRNRPWRLREKNPTGRLERWERQQMAMQDKNKHRPRHLRERNTSCRLECWERWQMAMEDKNKQWPQKLRQKFYLRKRTSESALSRQYSSLRKLIARWGHMLKRESELLDQQRQRVLHQRRAQQKKDQEERRRLEVRKQKQQREEERLRREWIRKRMRTDLTMDDILGPKYSH